MTIQIIRRASLGLAAGTIRTLAPATEAALVLDGEAIYATAPNPGGNDLAIRYDPNTGQIVAGDGSAIPSQVALSSLVSTPGIVDAWPMTLPYLLGAPPTLALGAANAATAIATAIDTLADTPGAFNYIGSPTPTQGAAWKQIGYWPLNTAIVGSTIIECWVNLSDATGRFEIILQDNTSGATVGLRLAVQQRDGSWGYASTLASFVAPTTTNTNKYRGLVTMGAAGKYKIRIECNAGCGFWGLAMLPADIVAATPKRRKKYLILTDSYGSTSSDSGGYLLTADAWPNKLRYLTNLDLAVAAASACGWSQKANGALLKVNDYLANCITTLLAQGPLDGVIFAHGYNDYTSAWAAATITAEVSTAIATCQSLLPGKEIIAISPWATKTLGGTTVQHLLGIRDAVKDAVKAAGGRFIDLISQVPPEFVGSTWADSLQASVIATATSIQVATAPTPYRACVAAGGRSGWWVYIKDGANSEMRQVTAMGSTDPRTLTIGALTYAHAAGTPVYIGGQSYITGTGKQGATVGDGVADRFVGTDGVHPTVAGHEHLALVIAGQLTRAA